MMILRVIGLEKQPYPSFLISSWRHDDCCCLALISSSLNRCICDDFSSTSLDSGRCQCSSCLERRSIEAEQAAEVDRLRQCWAELRRTVSEIYLMALRPSAWNDWVRDRPSDHLTNTKENIQSLCYRDPHRLYEHLRRLVCDWVADLKGKLHDMLSSQAKNPSLAADFIQDLLGGYDKLCCAAQYLTPAMLDLESEHLLRFSLTWDDLNKHLYQSVVYMDPLIQKSLPIFLYNPINFFI